MAPIPSVDVTDYCCDLNAAWTLVQKSGGGTITLYAGISSVTVEFCQDENTYAMRSGKVPAEALVHAVYAATGGCGPRGKLWEARQKKGRRKMKRGRSAK